MNNQARGGGNSDCRWAGILIVANQGVSSRVRALVSDTALYRIPTPPLESAGKKATARGVMQVETRLRQSALGGRRRGTAR